MKSEQAGSEPAGLEPVVWTDGEVVHGQGAVSEILDLIRPVSEGFMARGFGLYLVGGIVRDLAVGAIGQKYSLSSDIDLTSDAEPQQIKEILEPVASALWTQGEKFGTIGATVGGQALEITTHRGEIYSDDSRKPKVVFGSDLIVDLSRRDFTINTMAIAVDTGVLHDPFAGAGDLANRILKTPLDPSISFSDDPLRMLRAARFIPRFSLTPDESLSRAVTDLVDRMEIVSAERIHDEFERLLVLDDPSSGLEFLVQTGLFSHIVPAVLVADQPAAILAVGKANSAVARRAALCWFMSDSPVDDQARHWLNGLRYSGADRKDTLAVLAGMSDLLTSEEVSEAFIRRTVVARGLGRMPDIFEAVDAVTQLTQQTQLCVAEDAQSLLERLSVSEDLSDLSSPLSGELILRYLDISPGPIVGEAIAMLVNARVESGPLSTSQAEALLDSWFENRSDRGI